MTEAVLRVVPLAGETTWSFLHRVADAYGLQVSGLRAWWRWENPVPRGCGVRPDGEVLLDTVAQAQVAGWCRVPAGHLARALPSWAAGPEVLAGRGGSGGGRGWARWRMGALEWGPVVFACRLCAARRGAGSGRVWVYRPRWQRLCARHGRWLLDADRGHLVEWVDVCGLGGELRRAQRRWHRVAASAVASGVAPGEVFALAQAVVCGWWEREDFWARERVWGPRLEQVLGATRRRWDVAVSGWGDVQWRLLVRDAVLFPEVVTVAGALVDRQLVKRVGRTPRGLLRDQDQAGVRQFAAALGERLERPWLAEVESAGAPGPLARWMLVTIGEQRRADTAPPSRGLQGKWSVRAVHRPVEAGAGPFLPAGEGRSLPAGRGSAAAVAVPGGGHTERAADRRAESSGSSEGAGGRQADVAVGREPGGEPAAEREAAGPVWALRRWNARQFAQGVEHARRHAERHGHLALTHTASGIVDGFDLGRWLARRRTEAASLTAWQTAQLTGLDPWWNPPWPVGWQRCWHRARQYVDEHGPVLGGTSLNAVARWLQVWLRRQIADYDHLHPGQRALLAELGVTAREVEEFNSRAARRLSPARALAVAQAYAARHGHLAVTGPTLIDGIALDAYLSAARRRQRTEGRPTRLGTRLTALDMWWNPPWPLSWQRMWWAAHHHLHGLPAGTQWWPDAPGTQGALTWLRQQHARRSVLLTGQQQLTARLMRVGGQGPVWQPRISDHAWQTLTQLLPSRPATDRRYRSERQILEAIIHIACTRQTWPQLPQELGSFPACRNRYNRWHTDGTLTRICHAPLPHTDTHWQHQLTTYSREFLP
ncbi:putative transposase IS4/IS5 family [Actinobacteria bacterium OK006]|nr:putative transposase IS4/IS5 family [Actinobacteria bacterium OK006]